MTTRTPGPLPAIAAFVQKPAITSALDWSFFVFGGVSAIWLALLLIRESFSLGWGMIWFGVVFWGLLAYLVLPRLHRILTRIYVPDYFIGRARTSDGLLGDPINLALLGTEAQVHHVMLEAGWVRADDVSLATGWKIVTSTVLRRSYLEAPVSPLHLFGRKQDFAYQQEVDGNPGKRHHVRFWRCPPGWLLPGGHRVDWLAAGTYDRSVGFSLFTFQITHKIDAQTDVERDHIVATATAADSAVTVATIRDFSTGYHSRNGGGDAIVTDGHLPVISLTAVDAPTPPDAVPTDSRDKRPGATIVGALLLVARAAVVITLAVIVGATAAATGSGSVPVEGDPGQFALVLWGLAVGLLALAAVQLFIAWRVFLGSAGARVLAMVLAAISIVVQAGVVITGGPGITFNSNLAGLSLDILLILALSSERALIWAQRERKVPKRIYGRPGDAAAF